ncbi:MAG: hypothetical protein ACI3YK_05535 [Eubacteriales bacterium]
MPGRGGFGGPGGRGPGGRGPGGFGGPGRRGPGGFGGGRRPPLPPRRFGMWGRPYRGGCFGCMLPVIGTVLVIVAAVIAVILL